MAVLAEALGTPLLPWQEYVADVATERRPDGAYEYQVVVVTVPRQSGKTTLLRAVGTHRALVRRRDVFYTAQTGKDAGERWEDLVTAIGASSALRGRVTVRRAAGAKRVIFPGGAAFRAFAPTAESLHGYTPPCVMLDEAFAHSGPEGELLMGAIGPAQITLPDRQLWIVSTAGTAESVFLREWVDKGLAGADRVALFMWAAADDQDPMDPADVAAFHPAVGFTINGKTMEAADIVAQAGSNSRAEYERAYANRWTMTASHLLPPEVVKGLAADVPAPASPSELVLGYDVAHDRQAATVVATWRHEGTVHGKVVLAAPGYSWLAPAVEDLWDRWRPRAVVADDGGHAREVTAELTAAGVPVEVLTGREFATASGRGLARVQDDDMTHDGTGLMVDALCGLVTRPSSDGEVVSRRHSHGDVSAAVAFIVAAFHLEGLAEDDAPVFRFAAEGGAA